MVQKKLALAHHSVPRPRLEPVVTKAVTTQLMPNSLCHVLLLENAGCAHPSLHGSHLLYEGVLEDTELEAPVKLGTVFLYQKQL